MNMSITRLRDFYKIWRGKGSRPITPNLFHGCKGLLKIVGKNAPTMQGKMLLGCLFPESDQIKNLKSTYGWVTNAENFVKTVQTSRPWRQICAWAKFQILTVLGLYSHICARWAWNLARGSGPFGGFIPIFLPDEREIWHRGADLWFAPLCQISRLSEQCVVAKTPLYRPLSKRNAGMCR